MNLNRQFARNLTAQVSYTYSHCIDDGSFTSSLEEFGADQVDPYNQKYDYGNCIFDIRHNLSVNGLYALPFKGNRLLEGWQFATIFGAHSGLPLDVTRSESPTTTDNLSGETATRANYTFAPGCHPNQIVNQPITPGNPVIQWFNTACYTDPLEGYVGNVTRNSLPGPGSLALDFSILKNTKITERLNVQFRAEAFNIINKFNEGAPLATIGTATTGQIITSQAPVITPRQIQFALKFDF